VEPKGGGKIKNLAPDSEEKKVMTCAKRRGIEKKKGNKGKKSDGRKKEKCWIHI